MAAEHFQHKPDYTEDTMNTTEQQRRKKAPIVAAIALAAAAITASALGQTAPANANADYFVALAYSFESDVPGLANNQTDGEQARIAALLNCQDVHEGNHCAWYGTFKNECAALAVRGERDWATGTGQNLATAKQNALASNPGGRIAVSGCAHSLRKDGDSFPVPTHTMVPSAPQ